MLQRIGQSYILQELKRMPEPLQKQTVIRCGLGVLFAILLAVTAVVTRDVYLCLPCAGVMIFFISSAFFLFRRIVLGEYVIISGKCTAVGATVLKRRTKYMVLETEDSKVKVTLQGKLRTISAGTGVRLYIAADTPIYVQGEFLTLNSYIAIDILK